MLRDQSKSEKQLQSAGYVMRDTDLTTPGQPTTTFQDTQTAHYYLHTNPVTQEEEINYLDRPRTVYRGVGQNPANVRRARPRAQSVTHSRVNQVLRQLGFSL
jgi:hypothetical protein